VDEFWMVGLIFPPRFFLVCSPSFSISGYEYHLFHLISLCRKLHFVVNWGLGLGILGGWWNISFWLQVEGMEPT
jgi:hypothetical protein